MDAIMPHLRHSRAAPALAGRIAQVNKCSYNNSMEIIFDPIKDRSNIAKHGVSLADAAGLNWASVLLKPDTRRDYPELREIGYGLIGNVLFSVVLVQREGARYIISLRKANSREIQEYVAQT